MLEHTWVLSIDRLVPLGDFVFGLGLLLGGIEALIERRGAGGRWAAALPGTW